MPAKIKKYQKRTLFFQLVITVGVLSFFGASFVSAEQPFFEVKNGSIHAGAGLSQTNPGRSGGVCDGLSSTVGKIEGVVSGTTGSFSTYASFAKNQIVGLKTGLDSNIDDLLTFQNNASPFGEFSGDRTKGKCVKDYFSFVEADTELTTVPSNFPATFASGTYFHKVLGSALQLGDINLSAGNVHKQITLVVDGDVYITGNITNDDSFFGGSEYTVNVNNANRGDTPVFILIASGDIDIDPSVTHLEGLFSARGDINTCASDDPLTAPADLTTAVCSEQLYIGGAVMADDLHLRRTHGDLGGDAAEIIENTPDFRAIFDPTKSSSTGQFEVESVTELPPIF